jgi:hypothetical protein
MACPLDMLNVLGFSSIAQSEPRVNPQGVLSSNRNSINGLTMTTYRRKPCLADPSVQYQLSISRASFMKVLLYVGIFLAIFDAGEIGVILIGMPGLEMRLARYPQFYSRIGFVHEFRPLSAAQVRQLLEQCWTPPGANLPEQPWAEEAIAAIIRITGGNFRLLHRPLTQMERILEVNGLHVITKAVVETARETPVIGEA